jgi:heme/copper-type cytochrome/quinol oxidase subunit 3
MDTRHIIVETETWSFASTRQNVRGQWYNAVVLGTPAITAGRSPLAVGFMIWLGSKLMFFAGLFATFITLRLRAPMKEAISEQRFCCSLL